MTSAIPERIKKTREFSEWQRALKDAATRSVIDARIKRVQFGIFGDVKPVGEGISELRVDYGPGYRVYFTEALSRAIVLLLVGGDKSTQKTDIRRAKRILYDLKQQPAKPTADVRMEAATKGRSKGARR